jgi:hypothetical protein
MVNLGATRHRDINGPTSAQSRSGRSRSGIPLALRDHHWSRPSCEIRRFARQACTGGSGDDGCRSGRYVHVGCHRCERRSCLFPRMCWLCFSSPRSGWREADHDRLGVHVGRGGILWVVPISRRVWRGSKLRPTPSGPSGEHRHAGSRAETLGCIQISGTWCADSVAAMSLADTKRRRLGSPREGGDRGVVPDLPGATGDPGEVHRAVHELPTRGNRPAARLVTGACCRRDRSLRCLPARRPRPLRLRPRAGSGPVRRAGYWTRRRCGPLAAGRRGRQRSQCTPSGPGAWAGSSRTSVSGRPRSVAARASRCRLPESSRRPGDGAAPPNPARVGQLLGPLVRDPGQRRGRPRARADLRRTGGLQRWPPHYADHHGDFIVLVNAYPGMGVVWGAEGAQECQVLLKLGQGRTVSKGLLDLACISVLGSHSHHLRDIEVFSARVNPVFLA